jgi:predicted nuclease of restriction endonuclease-like (RecB) superfamily
MKKKTATPHPLARGKAALAKKTVSNHESAFRQVVAFIEAARDQAYRAVNTGLIDLYWRVGEFISRKITADGWGKNTVSDLSAFIQARRPGISGFSASNLWRMRQFHDTYQHQPKLASLLRELNWTQNLLILGRAKRPEEREFYLRLCVREKWPVRELERQLASGLFERTVLAPPKLAPVVRELHPTAETLFKDAYLLDFLDLPAVHSEADLQRALIANLKRFLIELGRDFAFVGEQYLIQVGGRDFRLDLLFYHRELQCLVAFDLKIDQFQPEYLGKMEFYLEALDRDVRKRHERPSIGVLLCATKDNEVVEYSKPLAFSGPHCRIPNRAAGQANSSNASSTNSINSPCLKKQQRKQKLTNLGNDHPSRRLI